MSEPSCQRCIYRQPDERPDYSTSGFCHRFPHTVSVVATLDGGVNFENHRPWVTPDDWCGEYKPIETATVEAKRGPNKLVEVARRRVVTVGRP